MEIGVVTGIKLGIGLSIGAVIGWGCIVLVCLAVAVVVAAVS